MRRYVMRWDENVVSKAVNATTNQTSLCDLADTYVAHPLYGILILGTKYRLKEQQWSN